MEHDQPACTSLKNQAYLSETEEFHAFHISKRSYLQKERAYFNFVIFGFLWREI